MTDDKRETFLRQANVAVLGTVDARGRPHGAPVWYLYDDGIFRINTDRGSQKHRNIERNPNISLVIDRPAMPYYAVMIQGTAEIGPPLPDADHLKLSVRYLGEELGKRYAKRSGQLRRSR
jgi:PPOX class probable F420-dependent enzyme